jgi:hypothetical protein
MHTSTNLHMNFSWAFAAEMPMSSGSRTGLTKNDDFAAESSLSLGISVL